MPLFELVMKTQGWWHHRILPRKDLQVKVKADVIDVDVLLYPVEEEGVEYEDECAAFRHMCKFMEWALLLAHRFAWRHRQWGKWSVKALQGLGMLSVSVMLWVQESVVQWFESSEEGVSPS